MICVSLDMICIHVSKRATHPPISIKAYGITFHYSEQPRTVTSSYKYAAPNKNEKAKETLFHQNISWFNLEALYGVK